MAWNFERDSEWLADAGTSDAMGAFAKYCAYMALDCNDTGGKECLQQSAEYWAICKKKIDKAIDEKIKDLKARANNVK